jgi:hypothetical protein
MLVFPYHPDKALKMDARIDHVIFRLSLSSRQSIEDEC